jgi:hypothetical protein
MPSQKNLEQRPSQDEGVLGVALAEKKSQRGEGAKASTEMEHENLGSLHTIRCNGHLPPRQWAYHNRTKPVRHFGPLSPQFWRLASLLCAHWFSLKCV